MKYTIRRTTQFKRSFKLAVKRGKNPELLRNALTTGYGSAIWNQIG